MNMSIPWSKVFHIATGFAVGVAITSTQFAPAQRKQEPDAPVPFKRDDPENRALDANLYLQTSAEYRACCLQAYSTAISRLREEVGKLPKGQAKPPAVIMDLDETVLDNGAFQTKQLRSGLAYDQRTWDLWEEKGAAEVRLVPGAKEFILEAVKLKVAVIYISNRADRFKNQAKEALNLLGIPESNDDHWKLATSTTNKTERRIEVEKNFQVLLNIGDNLRDFDEQFRFSDLGMATRADLEKAIQQRKAKVDAAAAAFGSKWIILPNPVYGEWTKPLGKGKADYDMLLPTPGPG